MERITNNSKEIHKIGKVSKIILTEFTKLETILSEIHKIGIKNSQKL